MQQLHKNTPVSDRDIQVLEFIERNPGSTIRKIGRALQMCNGQVVVTLTSATHKEPRLYEDDHGGLFIGALT